VPATTNGPKTMWVDLRCDSGHYRNYPGQPRKPGVCGFLILRMESDTLRGTFEVKCPRCKKLKQFTVEDARTIAVVNR
jgi:phage FluMu protein Com